jgi:hypothetical protein
MYLENSGTRSLSNLGSRKAERIRIRNQHLVYDVSGVVLFKTGRDPWAHTGLSNNPTIMTI